MKKIVVAIAAGFGSLLFASPAFAIDELIVAPKTAPVGSTVTITANCYYDLDDTGLTGTGPFAALVNTVGDQEIVIPAGTPSGAYDITLKCEAASGPMIVMTETVTVTGGPAPTAVPSGPAKTGGGAESTDNTAMGIAALGAAGVIGAGLLIARRRRPNQ